MNELRGLLDLMRCNPRTLREIPPHMRQIQQQGTSKLCKELCEEVGGEGRVELLSLHNELAKLRVGD